MSDTNPLPQPEANLKAARDLAAAFPWALFDGFSALMERAKNRGDYEEVAYIKSLRDLFSEVVRAFVDYPIEPTPPDDRASATPAEAEDLAKKAVGDYLTACRMASADPVAMGNYLMKLASVTGCMMANAEGSEVAAERLTGTAAFVFKTMPRRPATLRPVQ